MLWESSEIVSKRFKIYKCRWVICLPLAGELDVEAPPEPSNGFGLMTGPRLDDLDRRRSFVEFI